MENFGQCMENYEKCMENVEKLWKMYGKYREIMENSVCNYNAY